MDDVACKSRTNCNPRFIYAFPLLGRTKIISDMERPMNNKVANDFRFLHDPAGKNPNYPLVGYYCLCKMLLFDIYLFILGWLVGWLVSNSRLAGSPGLSLVGYSNKVMTQ